MGLMRFTGSLGNNAPPDDSSPLSTFAYDSVEDDLILNQTTSYRILDGRPLALHYQAEAGQVITLRVSSEHDVAPQITILTTIDGNSHIIDVISLLEDVTAICGFTFAKTGAYTFTFDAPLSSTYHVRFDSGDTCDQE